jgi:phosphopantetheine adenylyltransferase
MKVVFVEEGNRESILLGVAVENKKKKCKFMSVEKRYTLFKRRVKEANKILKEMCFFFLKKLRMRFVIP